MINNIEEDYSFTHVYCYKRRVFDNRLVLIGEVAYDNGSDKGFYVPWNGKIVGTKECTTKNTYYPDIYDIEGNILKVDSHAYEVQLYLEPPSNEFLSNVGNYPLTIGMVDQSSPDRRCELEITYWDSYIDNRVIDICYQTNELYKELRKLRGVQ